MEKTGIGTGKQRQREKNMWQDCEVIYGRCGHAPGRNGIRLEGGIQKDARDHHEPDRIIGGRTKRNDGRKLLEGTDPSDFKDHHLFIPGIASSPVTFITDT